MATSPVPQIIYCYNVSYREMNNSPLWEYIDTRVCGGGICVDKWKRSHVGIAVDIEYESVMLVAPE